MKRIGSFAPQSITLRKGPNPSFEIANASPSQHTPGRHRAARAQPRLVQKTHRGYLFFRADCCIIDAENLALQGFAALPPPCFARLRLLTASQSLPCEQKRLLRCIMNAENLALQGFAALPPPCFARLRLLTASQSLPCEQKRLLRCIMNAENLALQGFAALPLPCFARLRLLPAAQSLPCKQKRLLSCIIIKTKDA